jgi:uncharacterized protein (DUF362 family)
MSNRAYIQSLTATDYRLAIQEGLAFIRFGEMIHPQARIFIKPNLTFPEYRPGVMTNPAAIEAAIQALKDYSPNIIIGDSDSGGYNRFSMSKVYEQTGIYDFASRYGVQIVNLSNLTRKSINFEYQNKAFQLDLPALLVEDIDILITMPVPKVHGNTTVSLTFKNQWGCIPENKDRLRLHPYFKHVILEVNKAIKSKVAIIDGLYGLTENGPMRGKPIQTNWLMVTEGIGTGARLCCEIMGFPLSSVPHLRYAEENHWIPSRDAIQLNQDLAPFVKEKFSLRRKFTDYPGLLAFNHAWIAHLAYFSPLSDILHRLLYLVREPFYDYDKYTVKK